jgi:hypothetical protein
MQRRLALLVRRRVARLALPAIAMLVAACGASTPARAAWVKFIAKSTHDSYVDTATLHKEGDFRRGWRLDDFKKRSARGEWSQLTGWELDCRHQRYRALAVTSYAGHMGNGNAVTASHTAGGWVVIEVNSLAARASQWACKV